MSHLVGLDPGRAKCGLVLVDPDQRLVLDGVVLPPSRVISQLKTWSNQGELRLILLGNGTSSEQWNPALQQLASVEIVEERGTTLRARERYWQLWPAKGWRQLLPRGLRLPPGELDAVAALVMVEDHLGHQCQWPQPRPAFKSVPAP